MYLCELALEFAREHLKPGGSFLVKTFQGYGYNEYIAAMRDTFATVLTRKPKARATVARKCICLASRKKGMSG